MDEMKNYRKGEHCDFYVLLLLFVQLNKENNIKWDDRSDLFLLK